MNAPLDWIKAVPEPARTYRKMVVGWQNSVTALNATVRVFNEEYLKSQEVKDRDTHHVMREIAVKKLVISALFELQPQIDVWYRRLMDDKVVSFETTEKKKSVKHLLAQVKKFEGIRNATFHFGDVNEPTEEMLRLYEEIHATDLKLLNRILEELIGLGYMLEHDALTKT